MNIKEAKEEIIRTIKAYTAVDEDDQPVIPISAQRPLLLMGPPGIGKTAVMEQAVKSLWCGTSVLYDHPPYQTECSRITGACSQDLWGKGIYGHPVYDE